MSWFRIPLKTGVHSGSSNQQNRSNDTDTTASGSNPRRLVGSLWKQAGEAHRARDSVVLAAPAAHLTEQAGTLPPLEVSNLDQLFLPGLRDHDAGGEHFLLSQVAQATKDKK